MAAAASIAAILVFSPFSPPPAKADLAQIKAASAQLESQLQSPAAEGRVVSGREAALIAQLEDQIAQIDGQLATQRAAQVDAQVQLWQQRVDLMNQLVQVRVVRASYVGL
jgi:TolA-binding protein